MNVVNWHLCRAGYHLSNKSNFNKCYDKEVCKQTVTHLAMSVVLSASDERVCVWLVKLRRRN
jgi:hypothetical protein